jgi:hypothetical protein
MHQVTTAEQVHEGGIGDDGPSSMSHLQPYRW